MECVAKSISFILALLLFVNVVNAQIGQVYDIANTKNLEVGVGMPLYVRSTNNITENGTAIFSKQTISSQVNLYMNEYMFKTVGFLIIQDNIGHVLLIKVTNPEEEKALQIYANKLEAALVEKEALRDDKNKLNEQVNNLVNVNREITDNLTYYKSYVDANLTLVEKKYIVDDAAFIQAVIAYSREESPKQLIDRHLGMFLATFIIGMIVASGVVYVLKKFHFEHVSFGQG